MGEEALLRVSATFDAVHCQCGWRLPLNVIPVQFQAPPEATRGSEEGERGVVHARERAAVERAAELDVIVGLAVFVCEARAEGFPYEARLDKLHEALVRKYTLGQRLSPAVPAEESVTRVEAGGAVGMVHGDRPPTEEDRKAIAAIVGAVAERMHVEAHGRVSLLAHAMDWPGMAILVICPACGEQHCLQRKGD